MASSEADKSISFTVAEIRMFRRRRRTSLHKISDLERSQEQLENRKKKLEALPTPPARVILTLEESIADLADRIIDKLFVSEILQALSNGHLPYVPMDTGYIVPGKAPQHPDYKKTLELLGQFGPPPTMSGANRSITAGHGIFHLIALRNFIRQADLEIIEDYAGSFASLIDKTNYIDKGTGPGVPTNHFLTVTDPARPVSCSLVDIEASKLDEAEILIKGRDKKLKIFKIHANMLTKPFFEHEIWERANRKLITSFGNTHSDFKDDQEDFYYNELFNVMQAGDHALFFQDYTTHLETIREAYEHYYYKQFFANAFVEAMARLGVTNLDYSAIDCEIRFLKNKEDETVIVEMNIINKKHQELTIGRTDAFVLERGRINIGYIRKRSPQAYQNRVESFGFNVEKRFPWRPVEPQYANTDYAATLIVS